MGMLPVRSARTNGAISIAKTALSIRQEVCPTKHNGRGTATAVRTVTAAATATTVITNSVAVKYRKSNL